MRNIPNGHLYIDPLVDVVKKILKSKTTVEIKFRALMVIYIKNTQFLKEAMDTRNKELSKYVNEKIMSRLKEIAKLSLK